MDCWDIGIRGVHRITGIKAVHWVEGIIRSEGLGRIQRIVRGILSGRIEDIVVARIFLVEAGISECRCV
jgi:hypothetical protein